MSLTEFLLEFEELELQAEIISATFSFCYEDLSEQTNEKAELVIDGLFNQIYTLADKMNSLIQKGWNEVRKDKYRKG